MNEVDRILDLLNDIEYDFYYCHPVHVAHIHIVRFDTNERSISLMCGDYEGMTGYDLAAVFSGITTCGFGLDRVCPHCLKKYIENPLNYNDHISIEKIRGRYLLRRERKTYRDLYHYDKPSN
jgi:hypothetical protein